MKKCNFLWGLFACLFLLSGCNKEEFPVGESEKDNTPEEEVVLNTVKLQFDLGAESRAVVPLDFNTYEVKAYVFQSQSTAKKSLGHWEKWSNTWSDYLFLDEYKVDSSLFDLNLVASEVPSLVSPLLRTAYRYKYKVVFLAAPKDSNALPALMKKDEDNYQWALTNSFSGNGAQVLLRDVLVLDNVPSEYPTGEESLDYGKLGDRYVNEKIRTILSRKHGEVEVTVMRNASELIPGLQEATEVECTLSNVSPQMYLSNDEKYSREYAGGTYTYDVTVLDSYDYHVEQRFAVDFVNHNAEVLTLSCLPHYYEMTSTDKEGVGVTLRFLKGEDEIGRVSIDPQKGLYVYPNTKSLVRLGKDGFVFGKPIDLDDDDWDGIH